MVGRDRLRDRKKRNKAGRAAKLQGKRRISKNIAIWILDNILERVENTKQSAKDCRSLLDPVLDNICGQTVSNSTILNSLSSTNSPKNQWVVDASPCAPQPTCSKYMEWDISLTSPTVLQDPTEEVVNKGGLQTKEKPQDKLFHSPSIFEPDEYGFFNDPKLLEEYERIEDHTLEIEYEKDQKVLSGCRIVDIAYFLKRSMRLQVDHNRRCTGGQLEICGEKRQGLLSTFILKCNFCNREVSICNEEPLQDKSIINTAAVWGTLATGSTHAHMTEFLSVMDIPAMSKYTFYNIQKELGQVWQDSLWRILEEAGKEEHEAAIARGDVDEDGIPFITVYVDGGWSKRSYGHTYNACSGVAVIIGKHSGKLLFVGVRNKYCCICARCENKGDVPKEHICFKNWSGSSTSMEQDIVVEGFSVSIDQHHLRYKKFIADGDSSVYSRIKEKVPYGLQVTKVECMNHVLKNYGKSLYKTKSDTKGVSLQARKLLSKDIIDELVKAVQTAIYANVQDPDCLKIDIRNTVNHVFGNHVSCKEYLCTNIGDLSNDKTKQLMETGLHHHIYGAMNQLLTKAHLLVDKETNNRAELFMSILVRFNMGKRLNLIQRDSFNIRSQITGLKYNEGHGWHKKPWKKLFDRSPGKNLKHYMEAQNRRMQRKRENPYKKPAVPKKIKFTKEVQTEYGPNVSEVYLPDDDLKKEIENLVNRLQVTQEQQHKICKDTIGQFDNPVYMSQRMHRLTASNFGTVIKRKETTSCDVLVKKLLSPQSFSTAATLYGKANEGTAISMFEELSGKNVQRSGLFVDVENGFLGASPDGIITNDEIVEVKCSYKVATSEKSLEEAVIGNLVPYLTQSDGKISIRKTHDYYYQIQGQLSITGASKCFFLVYSGAKNNLFVEEIERDETFWRDTMLPKLKRFYLDCIAPEIILDRRSKNLKCLDPPYIIEAQKKLATKAQKKAATKNKQ